MAGVPQAQESLWDCFSELCAFRVFDRPSDFEILWLDDSAFRNHLDDRIFSGGHPDAAFPLSKVR
jgi:hypothetical protein